MDNHKEEEGMDLMLKSRMWECPVCSHYFDGLIDDAHRDTGTLCPLCEAPCAIEDEKITAPNVSTRISASKPDGLTTDATKRLVKAAKVESEMFNLPPSKRGEHKDEIRRLKSVKPVVKK